MGRETRRCFITAPVTESRIKIRFRAFPDEIIIQNQCS